MNDINDHPDRLTHAWNLLGRYRWRFMLTGFGAALLVLAVSMFLPRKYEAEATFERRSDLVMHELASRGRVSQMSRTLRRTAQADLTDRPAVSRVVDQLGLADTDPSQPGAELERRELINHIRRNLRVTVDLATTNLERVRLTLIDEDPERARAVVNRLIDNYIDEHEAEWEKSLKQAAHFFEQQHEKYATRIDELEEQRVRFELENAELLPDDIASLQERIAETEAELLEARQRKEAADKWVQTLKAQLNEHTEAPQTETSVTMRPNPDIVTLDARLDEYHRNLDKMLTVQRMTPRHPAVQTLKAKIAELEKRRAALPEEVVSERTLSAGEGKTAVKARLAEARSEAEAAAAAVKLAESQLDRLSGINTKMYPVRSAYRRLEREIDDVQRQIDFWDDNLRRVNMAMAAEIGQHGVSMTFTQPCGQITVPSSPDLAQVIFAAIAAAGVAGVLTLFLSDRGDCTFADLREPAGELGLPLLGAIGELVTKRTARWRNFVRSVLYPACVMLMLFVLAAAFYATYLELRTPRVEGNFLQRVISRIDGGADAKPEPPKNETAVADPNSTAQTPRRSTPKEG